MADSADQLAAAIRAVVNETVHRALLTRQLAQTPPPPPEPKVLEESRISWPPHRMLYSLKDVQQRLSIGRSTVYQLIGNGQLPSVKIGRRRFITAAALETYIESLRNA